jgi:hypothetical protein
LISFFSNGETFQIKIIKSLTVTREKNPESVTAGFRAKVSGKTRQSGRGGLRKTVRFARISFRQTICRRKKAFVRLMIRISGGRAVSKR